MLLCKGISSAKDSAEAYVCGFYGGLKSRHIFFQLIWITGTKFTNEKKFMTCKGWLVKKNSHHNHRALQNQWTKIP